MISLFSESTVHAEGKERKNKKDGRYKQQQKKQREKERKAGGAAAQCTATAFIFCDRALTMTVQRVAADPIKQP